jgi:hypothetical protein
MLMGGRVGCAQRAGLGTAQQMAAAILVTSLNFLAP